MSLHLIDTNGVLVDPESLQDFLLQTTKGRSLHDVGVNYHVVCIFGGQSSGKSTLLNELFGTKFQTMDSSVHRGQTTQGAFLSPSVLTGSGELASSGPLLLLDLEGTDGLERGENQSFERQLSLFGLSVADTLIINMWTVDVGRVNGANLTLLRTILEVNLHLFLHDGYETDEKPTLLVVLRDFSEDDPAPVLATVRKSFDTVWEGIRKPAEFTTSSLDEFFHFRCFLLPHFKFQKQEFKHSVTELRQWFLSRSDQQYLFQDNGMFRNIPLEGLSAYLSNCWKAILSSKELDIPSQREMLARHRCTEVSGQLRAAFVERGDALIKTIESGDVVQHLREQLDSSMKQTVETYREVTKLYNDSVVQEFELQLRQQLVSIASSVMGTYSKRIAVEVAGVLENQVQTFVDRGIQRLLAAGQKQAFLPIDEGSGDEKRFKVDNEACKEAVMQFWESLCGDISELLERVRHQRPPSAELFGCFVSVVKDDEVLRLCVSSAITSEVTQRLRSRFVSMAANAPDTLHRLFEKCLSHTPSDQIRVVRSVRALEELVPCARQGVLYVLSALTYFRLEVTESSVALDGSQTKVVPESLQVALSLSRSLLKVGNNEEEDRFFLHFESVTDTPSYPSAFHVVTGAVTEGVKQHGILITASSMNHVFHQVAERTDFTIQTKVQAIINSRQNIPIWVFPALFILGFNEMMYVVRSPLLLLMVIGVVFVFGRATVLNMWEELMDACPPWVAQMVTSKVKVLLTQAGVWKEDEHKAPRENSQKLKSD